MAKVLALSPTDNHHLQAREDSDPDESDEDKAIPSQYKPKAKDDGLGKGDMTKAIINDKFYDDGLEASEDLDYSSDEGGKRLVVLKSSR